MSWWTIPVEMSPVEAHIHADRRLAFQVLTAFGAKQADGGYSRVLKTEGQWRLVEFHQPVGNRMVSTVEWVLAKEPEEVHFIGARGPLKLLEDRFLLADVEGCTRFSYHSTIGLPGSLAGWLIARFRVKRIVERFMAEHVQELKHAIEERAKRSKVFPYRPCGLDTEGG